MALPTVAVSAQLVDQGANPIVGATVTALLNFVDYYGKEVVAPAVISGVTDNNGNVTLNLWPNVLGTQGSQYQFNCIVNGQTIINGAGPVPNSACKIVDVINAVYPGTPQTPFPTGNFADAETPGGAVDGNNRIFTLAHAPSPLASLEVFKNGMRLRAGVDYVPAVQSFTYVAGVQPQLGEIHDCSYRY